MKRLAIFFILMIALNTNLPASAHHCSSHYYLTYKDYFQEEHNFADCNRHSMLKETSVYYYSNGTRRSYTTSTIFNEDGSVLESNCSNVKHIIYNKKHYFTFYKNKKYQILDENGNYLTVKDYKYMQEIAPNKLLVKLNKKYGIINLKEDVITPIKYKKFEQIGKNLYLTKLNVYYGMTDNSNNSLIKNEHDKIVPLYETFILKKYDKYGLSDKNGKIILPVEYDKIKKLGEYILVKKDGKYGILDSGGNIIAQPIYKKIRLERNSLEGKLHKNNWEKLF